MRCPADPNRTCCLDHLVKSAVAASVQAGQSMVAHFESQGLLRLRLR